MVHSLYGAVRGCRAGIDRRTRQSYLREPGSRFRHGRVGNHPPSEPFVDVDDAGRASKRGQMTDIDFLRELTAEAAKAVLDVYGSDFEVESKDDSSPLTLADRRSHDIICRGLKAAYPDIPILSEEGHSIQYDIRREWSRFWLVDPLDGTKEFVKKNGEFAINIALVEGGAPVLGSIGIPVTGAFFAGRMGEGCWQVGRDGRRRVRVSEPQASRPIRIVKSRSHPSQEMQAILALMPSHELITMGSAIKFCHMAAGEADFYPRLGHTWEWDTAAGQALVTAAGGVMVDSRGEPLRYNKPTLLNGPYFVAPSLEWLEGTGVLDVARSLESVG